MSITCSCGDPISQPSNDPCSKLGLGKQIVGIFAQKMEGSPFNGSTIVTSSSGGTITTQAHWQAKMAATNADRIIFLKNIAGAEVPEANTQELTGNDVEYGGKVQTDMERMVKGRLQYPALATITAVNASKCWPKMRVWLLDDKGFLQGGNDGIENVNLNFKNLIRPGIGSNIPVHFPFEVSWNNLEEAEVSTTPSTFLADL